MIENQALRPPRKGNAVVKLLGWVLVVQAAFWALALVVRTPVVDEVFTQNKLEHVRLLANDGTLRQPSGQPDYYLGEDRNARFIANLTLERPEKGLVVFAPRYNRRISLTVNGQPIPPSDAPTWRAGRLGAKWVVPGAMLNAGENRLAVGVERECCRAYLSSLIAAPPGAIDFAILRWRLQAAGPPFGLLVVGLVGAIASVLIAGNSAYRPIAMAAGLTFFGMALSGLWQIDILSETSEPIYNALGHLSLLATFAGLVALADRWFPGGPRFDRWLVGATLILLIPIVLGAVVGEGVPLPLSQSYEAVVLVLANVAIVWTICRGLKAQPQGLALDAAVMLLVPTIALTDFLDSLDRDPLSLGSAPLGIFALALLIMFSILRRGRKLADRLENANAELETTIAQKQAELELTAALLREKEAEAAVQEERTRIMRDMHDGMGSQLLSALMLSRDEASSREAIAEYVETAIEDLRLLIESLDSVGDSLDVALGQFRERAETKLRAAGMNLVWSNHLTNEPLVLPPRAILAVYRIMQEAVSNAIRHSGGQKVTIEIASRRGGGASIAISDDGHPGSAPWKKGHGLLNMQARAAAFGAELAIDPSPGGTTVSLAIPASVSIGRPASSLSVGV